MTQLPLQVGPQPPLLLSARFDLFRLGLFPSRAGLCAAGVDTEGRCHYFRPPLPSDDDERWDWLCTIRHLQGPDMELVIPDSLARLDRIGRLALCCNIPVWLAPDPLVAAISQVAFGRAFPRSVATVLARLPSCSAWRPHLRRVTSLDDSRQILLV